MPFCCLSLYNFIPWTTRDLHHLLLLVVRDPQRSSSSICQPCPSHHNIDFLLCSIYYSSLIIPFLQVLRDTRGSIIKRHPNIQNGHITPSSHYDLENLIDDKAIYVDLLSVDVSLLHQQTCSRPLLNIRLPDGFIMDGIRYSQSTPILQSD